MGFGTLSEGEYQRAAASKVIASVLLPICHPADIATWCEALKLDAQRHSADVCEFQMVFSAAVVPRRSVGLSATPYPCPENICEGAAALGTLSALVLDVVGKL